MKSAQELLSEHKTDPFTRVCYDLNHDSPQLYSEEALIEFAINYAAQVQEAQIVECCNTPIDEEMNHQTREREYKLVNKYVKRVELI